MIRAYSQRLLSPYSGQLQIAESDRARAITIDGDSWEVHFRHSVGAGNGRDGQEAQRSFFRRATEIKQSELGRMSEQSSSADGEIDDRILELTRFLTGASLPFTAADHYEYWLLDAKDQAPLALIFSCTAAGEMENFPSRPEWTALPAAVMPIEPTEEETARSDSPVNYRVERLVAERAGHNPRASWFKREAGESGGFPAFLLREDWQEEAQQQLCQRYLQRQSARLLMLHGLQHDDRKRMELAARDHVFEVERFYLLYPEVIDEQLMNAIRVEARLRQSTEEQFPLQNRRDGVLYI